MADHYRVYKTEIEDFRKDGGIVERSHGCNTSRHVDVLNVVYYDSDGEVRFSERLTFIERGACDESCGNGRCFDYP